MTQLLVEERASNEQAFEEEVYIFPASFAQQRLWFVDQLEPGSPFYNVPLAVRVEGPLEATTLARALQAMVERHESLRTTFATEAGQPVQVIHPCLTIPLEQIDLQWLPAAQRETSARRLADTEARRPFDLTAGPLLRTKLVTLAPDDQLLLLTLHHIICDGWSMEIFTRELMALYAAFAQAKPSPLSALPIQYADYAEWQRQWLQGEELARQLRYWKQQLAGLSVLDLPTDQPRPPIQGAAGAREVRLLPQRLSEPLLALSRQENATLFMTLLAAFTVLLHRYTGQEDIVVGTDIANRTQRETEGLIGILANQLVLRTHLDGNPTFRALLARVRDVVLGAYDHQDLPFDRLVEALNPPRDLSRSPLFQVKFVFQNTPTATTAMALPNLVLRPLAIAKETARFDLLWTMRETAQGLAATVEYRTDLFFAATIGRMLDQFTLLLETVIAQPDARLTDLVQPLRAAEKEQQQSQQQAFQEIRQNKRKTVKPKPISATSK